MIYKGTPVTLEWTRYRNGRLALTLMTTGPEAEPMARVTVNLPEMSLEDGRAFVKNYAEGEGMLDWLRINGLASPTGRMVRSGFVLIPEVKWERGVHWSVAP